MAEQAIERVPTDQSADPYVAHLEHRLEQTERELLRLKQEHDEPEQRDRRGVGGTPNLSGEVSRLLEKGVPDPSAFDGLGEDATLHRLLTDGPEALTSGRTPVYPVHERAHMVLANAPSLAREQSGDGSALYLTAPTIKRFLESREDQRLKHTQVRRAFEAIEEAGQEYPRAPVLHKNRDGVIELVLFDYPRLYDRAVV